MMPVAGAPPPSYVSLALMTAEELTEALSISKTTLGIWKKEGIPCVHIGRRTGKGARGLRYNLLDVRRWLDRREAARRAASHAGQDDAPAPAP